MLSIQNNALRLEPITVQTPLGPRSFFFAFRGLTRCSSNDALMSAIDQVKDSESQIDLAYSLGFGSFTVENAKENIGEHAKSLSNYGMKEKSKEVNVRWNYKVALKNFKR